MTIPSSGPVTFTDIQTEFGGTNPIALNEYYAGGGLVPAGTTGTYGAVPSSGQISVQNFYGTTAFTPVYIEEVFSTYLYTGNGGPTSQTITNGIDLSTKGGLVWIKSRSNALPHEIVDTSRAKIGQYYPMLNSASTNADTAGDLTTFNNNGFTVYNSTSYANNSPFTYCSWTFREQPKFFDIVTYTGNSTAGRTIAHNLGSTPGCIIVKNTTASSIWSVYHRSQGATKVGILNGDNVFSTSSAYWNDTAPTSSVFTVGAAGAVNDSGQTYVAYLWAHDAGGFGAAGTDNVVSCGTFTADASGNVTVNLGYEPQWLMFKKPNVADDWVILDTMRNWTYDESSQLKPNTTGAENSPLYCTPNQTGFTAINGGFNSNATYVYVAIRRGPMKVPTVGTTVFNPNAYNGTGTGSIQTLTTNFPVDLYITCSRQSGFTSKYAGNRLTGKTNYLVTNSTGAQSGIGGGNGVNNDVGFASNIGIGVQGDWNNPSSPGYSPFIMWNFKRAPSVLDVVCYTGNSTAGRTVNHNLGVAPELLIVKRRSLGGGQGWVVYAAPLGNTQVLTLQLTDAAFTFGYWNNTTPTSSVFSLNSDADVNSSSYTYVAYLFATCAGVSKVGSYTGTSALQTVNCGFTTGARFVLIKRSDSTGNWFVYDSARGITSSDDPYLALNSTANEVANTNYVDTTSVGFQVTAAAPAELNANGGTYIFLAIA